MYNEVILINPNNLSDEKKETSFHIPKLKTSSFGRRNICGNGGWTGDDAFLKSVWPGVKKALSFAWIPNGWDADKDGVMEGR